MSNGIRTTNLERQFAIDELIGNVTDEGVEKTSRIPMASVAQQIVVSGPFTLGDGFWAATYAILAANPPADENTPGYVIDDPDPTKNGVYLPSGATWVRKRGFPDAITMLTNVGGTASAITAESKPGIDPAQVVAYILPVAQTNPGSVTLVVDGGDPLPLLDPAGAALAPGALVAGRITMVVPNGDEYRLLSPALAVAAFDHKGTWAAPTAYTEGQVVTGSDGNWYQLKVPAATGDDPVSGGSGDWLQILVGAAISDRSLGEVKLTKRLSARVGALFDTVADLVASALSYTDIDPGEIVEAQDFHYKVAASDASDAHVETAGGVKLYVLGNEVSFDAFAPAKDGVTDDTAVWDKAVTYVSGVKGKLIVAAGDYSIHNGTLKSNVHIEFMPGARLIQPDSVSVDLTSPKVLYGLGTTGTPVDVTADAGIEELTVTVADGDSAGFSVGDYALIYDDDYVFPIPLAGRNEEVVRIAETTSTTITFSKGLTTALTTANNVKIAPLDPIQNLTISGAGEVIVGINRAAGIRVGRGVNCIIKDGVTVRRSRGGGSFVFDTCFDCHISMVSAFDGQSPGTGGTGYGISFTASCTFCSVTGSYFENLRENTFTNRTRWCLFDGNTCSNMIDSGWNTHGAGCDHNVCQNNIFRDCSQAVGVGWGGSARADNDNVVQNNVIEDCANGVSLSGNSTGPIIGLRNIVTGNVIRDASNRGVSVFYQEEFSVCGNEIYDNSTVGASGIYAVSTNDNGIICGNRIRSITGASAFGIRVSGSSNIMVSHNHVQDVLGSSAIPYYVPATQTDIRVQLNSFLDCNAVSLAGAAVNTLNTWN